MHFFYFQEENVHQQLKDIVETGSFEFLQEDKFVLKFHGNVQGTDRVKDEEWSLEKISDFTTAIQFYERDETMDKIRIFRQSLEVLKKFLHY